MVSRLLAGAILLTLSLVQPALSQPVVLPPLVPIYTPIFLAPLPFTIGPTTGTRERTCLPIPAGQDPVVSGCVASYTLTPASVDLDARGYGVGLLTTVSFAGCRAAGTCPAGTAPARSIGWDAADGAFLFQAAMPLSAPAGIDRFCATARQLQPVPPGQPPQSPFSSTALDCIALLPALETMAGGFMITPVAAGLKLEGWFLDLSTDAPIELGFGRGSGPNAPSTVTTMANIPDFRVASFWPGYSSRHGFSVVLPYAGTPGRSQICLTPGATSAPSRCFAYEERSVAFVPPAITRGTPLQVTLRNAPAGAMVAVNLKAQPGHFMRSWTEPSIWSATADASGAVDITIPTVDLPPGQYRVAFHCKPECPGGGLKASDLVGGTPWSGSIILGPTTSIDATVTRGLTVTLPQPNQVRVAGSGFAAGETVAVIFVPPLGNVDGFPHEASPVAYTKADAGGAFSVDIDVRGLAIQGRPSEVSQVIARDHSMQPVVAATAAFP